MTSPAAIKQADLQRVANVAKHTNVMVEIIVNNTVIRIYSEFIIPSSETQKKEEDFILY